jgi:prepilin-type processing-associated H-X9-DG protein
MFVNANVADRVTRTDYAINEGDYITDTPGGPESLAEGDDPNYQWTDVSKATGVSFLRSRIRPADVSDGVSNTILVGEKYVSQAGYFEGQDLGYDQPAYSGVDLDLNRWSIGPPLPDGLSPQVRRFGSTHSGGCQFALCDGSVRTINYSVNAETFRNLGNRMDGAHVEF